MSADKNSVRFEFVDEQIPVPMPDKASTCDISQSVDSELYNQKGFRRWDITFDGTIVVPLAYARPTVYDVFYLVLSDRFRAMGMTAVGDVDAKEFGTFEGKKEKKLYPTRFRCTEKIFGREATFSVVYTLLGANLSNILEEAGLWQPIKDTSFASWRKSMETSAHHPRGSARLSDEKDIIIDLCTRQPPAIAGQTTLKPAGRGRVSAANGGKTKVKPEDSWIAYECGLMIVKRNRVARHQPLPVEDPDKFITIAGPSATGAFSQLDKSKDSTISFEPRPSVQSVIQVLGDPTYDIVLYGAAQRLGHLLAIPRLHSVGGVKPTEVEFIEDSRVVAMAGRVPIHGGWWRITYVLPAKPAGALPVPSNPLYDMDGGATSNALFG